jgi:hypothetical protein
MTTTTSTAGAWSIVVCAFAGLIGMLTVLYVSQRPKDGTRTPKRASHERAQLPGRVPTHAFPPPDEAAPVTTNPDAAPEPPSAKPLLGAQRGIREDAQRASR